MKTKILHLILILLVLACQKKKYPESVIEGAPVFSMKAIINNQSVSIIAGINDYGNFNSFVQDSNSIYNFYSELKQVNCSGTCPNSLSIQINDSKISATNAPVIIDSVLSLKNYDYLRGTNPNTYTASFSSSFNKPIGAILWDFGDGTTSTNANPTHVFRNGRYNVSLKIQSQNGCESAVNMPFKFSSNSYSNSVKITESNISSTTKQFNANLTGLAAQNYKWSFGDGTFSNLPNPTHNYTNGGSYPVELRVINVNNDTLIAKYNVVTQNDVSSCATNFFATALQGIPNTKGLSNVVVNWRDANGVLYSSNNPLQPNSSTFEIVSIDNFENNSNNELTKKIKIKFTCRVYNGSNSLLIKDAEAIMAISYK